MACQDIELVKKDLRFLQGIDSEYFRYVAQANAVALDGDDRHRAALALRAANHQGLETLFSLVGALIQAPECVVGWMLAYKPSELRKLVEAVSAGRRVRTRLTLPEISWPSLAELVHRPVGYGESKRKWVQVGFAGLWTRLARDYLDELGNLEYNSIKHGMRAKPGGFSFAFGKEDTPGLQAPDGAMKSLGGSVFGTSFYSRCDIGVDKVSFRPESHSLNWSPLNAINSLMMISMSIRNVVSALRILKGERPELCEFTTPDRESAFAEPWKVSVGVTGCRFEMTPAHTDFRVLTKESILKSYEGNRADKAEGS